MIIIIKVKINGGIFNYFDIVFETIRSDKFTITEAVANSYLEAFTNKLVTDVEIAVDTAYGNS